MMNRVVLIGQLNNTNEIKMFGEKNTEILEFLVEGIKCKTFGKLANEIKAMNPGIVVADGTIKLYDYTNKEGKTYPIQEIIINRLEPLNKQEQKQEQKDKPVDNWGSAKDIVIDPDELPFY